MVYSFPPLRVDKNARLMPFLDLCLSIYIRLIIKINFWQQPNMYSNTEATPLGKQAKRLPSTYGIHHLY